MMTSNSRTQDEHIVQLDGLRFFAVTTVMIAHWLQWQWSNVYLTSIPFVHGVILFFVLSGFLITRILLENRDYYNEQKLDKSKLLKNFYIRRFLRIFPIYYLLIFTLFFFDYNNTRELFPWLVSYSSNIYQSIHNVYIGEFNHFWSLAVEEQFYLFWPLLVVFTKPKHTLRLIVITIALGLLSRVYLYLYVGNWMATSYFTLCCMSSLGIGALIAYLNIYKKNAALFIQKWSFIIGALLLYLLLLFVNYKYQLNWYKEIFDEFAFSILSALIILRASQNGFGSIFKWILENKFILYSGKISYGLYVYHLFIPALFFYIAPRIGLAVTNKYTFFILLYLLTFLCAHISWKVIESPSNSLKKYFPYKQQR